MEMKVFAVFDIKAKAYMQPFFGGNAGSAMRAFGDEVVKDGSPIGRHPEDYQLFELGLFNDNTGVLSGLPNAKVLCTALDFVKEEVPNGKQS